MVFEIIIISYWKHIRVATADKPMTSDSTHAQRILILDDDWDQIRYLQNTLENSGYLVLSTQHHQSALQWFNQAPLPDLAIFDIHLGDAAPTGLALCGALKSAPTTRHIPVIVLTGYAGNQERLIDSDRSPDLVLDKPIDQPDLLRAVSRLLATRNQNQTALHLGGLRIDPKSRSVCFNGRQARNISPRLFDLLHILAQHWPNTLSRDFISRSLGAAIKDREVDVLISRLRARVMVEFSINLITTVHGDGYKLEAPASPTMLQRMPQQPPSDKKM